jgi:hypothetical protein
MAEINLEHLRRALAEEGVRIKDEVFDRVTRKLGNPHGCEHCGATQKLGRDNDEGTALVTTCCGSHIADLPKPEAEAPAETEEAA